MDVFGTLNGQRKKGDNYLNIFKSQHNSVIKISKGVVGYKTKTDSGTVREGKNSINNTSIYRVSQ